MKLRLKTILLSVCLGGSFYAHSQNNVIDQVVWFVGDEAILKSDVEAYRLQMLLEGGKIEGNPYCFIPEQIAVRKLYLHQAKADSIDVSAATVNRRVEMALNHAINQLGSKEELERRVGKSFASIREDRREQERENLIIQEMQRKLVGNVKLTPADVRRYYNKAVQDSLPFIPTKVEVQIMTIQPEVLLKEKDAVKAKLRELTDRIYKGESFATLALMYSEDPQSAKRGGELGFAGRATYVPEFSNAAFALNDPKKVSNIVETEYGFHIIQLIEKDGDRGNFRHILIKPKITEADTQAAMHKADSIMTQINAGKMTFDSMYPSAMFVPEDKRGKTMTFDDAIGYLSQDTDTRNNKGIMVNKNPQSDNQGTPKFEMQELPVAIAFQLEKMKVGDVSAPFVVQDYNGKSVVAVVKLRNRIEGHRANMQEDYTVLKSIAEEQKRQEILEKWVKEKIRNTEVRIVDGWQNCEFKYGEWGKRR